MQIQVSEPWYSAIALGVKTVEGRLFKGKFVDVKPGDYVYITCPEKTSSTIKCIVTKAVRYDNFESYLVREGLNTTLPGVHTLKDGILIYRKFYNEESEKNYGVIGIHLNVLYVL
jgi:ASC-1-like (ASCH) protein